jgi:hypothetical protein
MKGMPLVLLLLLLTMMIVVVVVARRLLLLLWLVLLQLGLTSIRPKGVYLHIWPMHRGSRIGSPPCADFTLLLLLGEGVMRMVCQKLMLLALLVACSFF